MERTATLLPIGRFSRLCGPTVKALRHYDEVGLLEPARVDGSTGYRYYSLEQLREAVAITGLRALDVPLEECKAILGERDPGAVRARLAARTARSSKHATPSCSAASTPSPSSSKAPRP